MKRLLLHIFIDMSKVVNQPKFALGGLRYDIEWANTVGGRVDLSHDASSLQLLESIVDPFQAVARRRTAPVLTCFERCRTLPQWELVAILNGV
jgi:hypothetical protein